MNVRRIPRVPPKRPASNTTLSRGEAWPDSVEGDADELFVVQSSRANANAAKSTSCASSRRRSSVVVPGLKDVVQGSTCATSSRPRVNACSSFYCFPDEPRKMRGLSIRPPDSKVGTAPAAVADASRPCGDAQARPQLRKSIPNATLAPTLSALQTRQKDRTGCGGTVYNGAR